jgi:hypothetical protein
VSVAFDEAHDRAAQPGQLVPQPLRRAAAVCSVVGEGAHTRDGEKLGELLEEPWLLAIYERVIHEGLVYRGSEGRAVKYAGNAERGRA